MISVKTLVFNPFGENTYLVYDDTGECLIIDPGCADSQEEELLQQTIEQEKLQPVRLLNTHCHIDHVLGNYFVSRHYNLPLEIPAHEQEVLASVPSYAPAYGFAGYRHVEPENLLHDGDLISFGHSSLQVIAVPGHTPGHIALASKEEHLCLAGDVLFDGSIGRTDLPGGDFNTLIRSIQERLFALPDDTVVYPGHGPTTTIGKEKRSNPFCALT